MSLILGYANKDNAIIMSDGRAGKPESGSEFYNKTKKINDNIILGFAGFTESAEFFLDNVIEQMGKERGEYYIDDFWKLVTFLMDNKRFQEWFHTSFIILGRDKDNKMYNSTIGNVTQFALQKHIVTTPRVCAIGGTIDGKIIEKIYLDNIRKIEIPIADCMKNTINQVSQLDSSVNTNYSSVTI